ncbi:hypothetical protein [Streptomyces sp. NPDC058291]|jgi:hypothetical protein|uniref:hypothetical protein n=1 Tax=Streptomyces sp. NPDC058291 TaxID=3346427 RepID=UPI0036E793EA
MTPLDGSTLDKLSGEDGPVVGLGGSQATPAVCRPLADMVTFGSSPKPTDVVARTVTQSSLAEMGTALSVALAGHAEADAVRVMAGLRSAVKACGSGFEDDGIPYSSVKAVTAAAKGDEAVAYQMVGEVNGRQMPMAFTVVRSGSTVVTFHAFNVLGDGSAAVPRALVTAQLARLAKAPST